MDELADALPDNAPRFILLSHPVTSVSVYSTIYSTSPRC